MSAFPTIGGTAGTTPWQTAQTHWNNVQVCRALLELAGAEDAPQGGNWNQYDTGAVKWFQDNNGLTSDGVVGDATWAKLCRVSAV